MRPAVAPMPRTALARWALLGCAVGLGACGEASVAPKAAEERATLPIMDRSGAAAPKAVDAPVVDPAQAVAGAGLEHAERLQAFFSGLARIKSREAEDDVRVVHFGDSHVAADLQTGVTRKLLQAHFGDGGRGFVALGEPWKHYVQDGVRAGHMLSFTPESGKWKSGKYEGDGMYGLGGVRIASSKRGAVAVSELRAGAATTGARLEVYYLESPQGGTFDVFVDGARAGSLHSKSAAVRSAFQSVQVPAGAHSLEIRAQGDGEVRVFGAALDAPAVGVVYDAIGRNGARAANMLDWQESHFAEQLAHRAPKLVILSFGTNEAGDEPNDDSYTQKLTTLLGRVAHAAPGASCLLVGPPDRAIQTEHGWETMPRVPELIALQRKVADAAGCAFYDQLRAMGGPGTVARWADETPPRAQKDRVHLSRDGYVELGTRFAKDLLDAYEESAPEGYGEAVAVHP